jgi:nucleotide-binding universal stress UspA family protein
MHGRRQFVRFALKDPDSAQPPRWLEKWNARIAEVRVPTRIHHILCAIDFSPGSRKALDQAVMLARRYQAPLSVLYVHQCSMPSYGVPYVGPEGFGAILLTDPERRELLARLETEVSGDRAAAGISIETVVDEAVNVPNAIVSRAHTTGADLIVIGTHGRSGFERLMLGSVAEKVLRKATCPVLTVPAGAPDVVPRDTTSTRRILCPIDFSQSSESALGYAAELAREAQARLTVLHVLELPPELSEYAEAMDLARYRDLRFQEAWIRLTRLMKAVVGETTLAHELILVGTPYKEILEVASSEAADLIVIGVRGRNTADVLFFGSTTNHVVRAAHCAVLTVKGDSGR